MGLYEERVLPRLIDVFLGRKAFDKLRSRSTAGLSGTVLEIGFGSGLNVPLYPAAVERVLAVDPAERGQRLATRRLAASEIPVEFIGLDGQDLPLADDSVDHVLSTWTLCTIPDVRAALSEIRRVLKPGGTFHVLEHGLAPDDTVVRWQRRLNPVQQKLAGGCHLDRPIAELLEEAGFDASDLASFYVAGPKPMSFMYQGVAVPRR